MQRTFTILKARYVKAGNAGLVIDRLIKEGFQIRAVKMLHLTKAQAEGFYYVHKERPFFGDLVRFMTEGPIVLMILEAEGAIEKLRKLMGATIRQGRGRHDSETVWIQHRTQCDSRFRRSGNIRVRDVILLQSTRNCLMSTWNSLGELSSLLAESFVLVGVFLDVRAQTAVSHWPSAAGFSLSRATILAFYFPLGTSIVISIILTIIVRLLTKR